MFFGEDVEEGGEFGEGEGVGGQVDFGLGGGAVGTDALVDVG